MEISVGGSDFKLSLPNFQVLVPVSGVGQIFGDNDFDKISKSIAKNNIVPALEKIISVEQLSDGIKILADFNISVMKKFVDEEEDTYAFLNLSNVELHIKFISLHEWKNFFHKRQSFFSLKRLSRKKLILLSIRFLKDFPYEIFLGIISFDTLRG